MALMETPPGAIGWQLPTFELPTPQGQPHTTQEAMGPNGLIVAFICNHCPYVVGVAQRMASDFADLQAMGVGVLAINANDYRAYPGDSPQRMIPFAETYGFTFPYLVDEDQSVAQSFDAVCTPDFFCFNAAGTLQYRGRLDDARMGPTNDRTRELFDAMVQIADTGLGPPQQWPSMGCSIKWRA